MSDLVLAGGTVVTAEASFRADVAVTGERISAVGHDLPRDGAEMVDVSGAPADARLHRRPHPPGHALRRHGDLRRLGHRHGGGRSPAGTTTVVDFSLQEVGGDAGRRRARVAGQGRGPHAHRLRAARGDHQPDRGGQGGDPLAAGARRLDGQDLHGLQGHAALHRGRGPVRGPPDRPRGRRAGDGARRERRRDRQAPGPGARPRGHRAALPRPHPARVGRGRGHRPRDPAGRDRRRPDPGRARLVRGGAARRCTAPTAAAARSTPRPARSTWSSATPTWPARASRAPSTSARPRCGTRRTGARSGTGSRPATCSSSARTTARSTSPARRSWAATTSP